MSTLIRDGVALAFEETGAGDPPVVLLHGIACDRRFLAPQLEHLARRHRTIALDLRGHGESDAPEQDYAIATFADDVAWACAALGVRRPVLVGHSLGGLVALQAAAADPELAGAVVALDSVLLPGEEHVRRMRDLFTRLRTPAYEAELRAHFARFFLKTDDPDRRAWILDAVARTPRHVVVSAWERGTDDFDGAAALRACRAPLLYVDAGTPNADLARAARLCPDLTIARTTGTGHFHQLEVPEQVNAAIERFLAAPRWGSVAP